jgi:hypothetical protein
MVATPMRSHPQLPIRARVSDPGREGVRMLLYKALQSVGTERTCYSKVGPLRPEYHHTAGTGHTQAAL